MCHISLFMFEVSMFSFSNMTGIPEDFKSADIFNAVEGISRKA